MASPFRMLRPLVLASASPRRRDFLSALGLDFTAAAADCEEPRPFPGEDPLCYTARTAEAKAVHVLKAFGGRLPNPAVLGADTAVILPFPGGSRILGKPADTDEAFAMLRELSGKTHRVVTACCLALGERTVRFSGEAEVTFADWPDAVLRAYAESGDPLDKAGAYGIQGGGAFLVSRICGSWSSVVGLPVDETAAVLIREGVIAEV
ncbi:MAG: Maf family protein [Mailhella sp.]|nr:Maf family protein [Mailhella sp.]